MERVRLNGSEIEISRVAFGAEPLGGYEWGNVDVAEAERAVGMALDLGVNLFDTADCYGRGESERRLGRALKERRGQAVIATKFGVKFNGNNRAYYDNDPAHIGEALDASLERLQTDYIDLYQLHWPDGHTPLEAVFDALDRLREQGKIRHYGVTNVAPEELLPHIGREGLASFSLQYSLAHRRSEVEIQSLCERGLAFLSWGSLGQGVLSGRYGKRHEWPEDDRRRRPRYENFHGKKLERNLILVERLREVARIEGYPGPSATALRFVLERFENSVAIVGVKSRRQITENVLAGEKTMSAGNFHRLSEEIVLQ